MVNINNPPTTAPLTAVRKLADETVNNSNVFQDDDHLFFDVSANRTWLIDYYLIVSSASFTPGFKWKLTAPAGASGYTGTDLVTAINTGSAWASGGGTSNPASTLSGASFTTINGIIAVRMTALVIIGATGGAITLQWAQNTATAEDTKLLMNSCLIAVKVS
jgi:hypothetical protein